MKRTPLVFLAVLTLFLSSCGTVELASLWKSQNVVIDGRVEDWKGALYFFEDKPIFVGVRNDEEFLYVCLQAAELSALGSVADRGVIAWFGPDGGNAKSLGIRFPAPMTPEKTEGQPGAGRGDEGQRGGRSGIPGRGGDEGPRPPLGDPGQVVILGSGKNPSVVLKKEDLKGLEVALEAHEGYFVYEIKIPLVRTPDFPYAVSGTPGKRIAVTLETPKMDAEMRDRGGMPGGGMGPGGIGRRGGMTGRGNPTEEGWDWEREGIGLKPIKLVLKITLAQKPS